MIDGGWLSLSIVKPEPALMIQGEERGMSVFNEALEWQNHAEQARQVAGRLTNPAARQAMLQAAKGYEYLARAATHRAQRLQAGADGAPRMASTNVATITKRRRDCFPCAQWLRNVGS
jgi:hypothetical protein